MSLVSNTFILFVVAAVVLYYLVPARFQWVVLLCFSYLYYVSGNVKYLFFILWSTIIVYSFGRLLEHKHETGADPKALKRTVALGLILNLGMLGVVKYTNFVVDSLNALLSVSIPGIAVLFPLGISFYTFQTSGYLLDVYWKRTKAEHNLLHFALFVSFFPQLLQGPIGKYDKLAPQFFTPHRPEGKRMLRALQRILYGLAKKMIIADWAGVFVDAIWDNPEYYTGVVIFGLVLYGIQLYADFSGAIDVVIGIGELFGITMDENFKQPYLATSISDFWKRWHITLGQWMKNYVFYPATLSDWMKNFTRWAKKVFGKKMGRVMPIALADLIVFFLVGVWHGADWTFIVYGLMNGAIMAFSQLMTDPYKKWKKALHIKGTEPAWHMFQIVRTYILVQLCWFFDRAANMDVSLTMIKNMFTHFDASQILEIAAGSGGTAFVPQALAIIAVGTIIMIAIGLLRERGIDIREKIAALPLPVGVAIYLLLFCLIGFVGCTAAPKGFIYAQF